MAGNRVKFKSTKVKASQSKYRKEAVVGGQLSVVILAYSLSTVTCHLFPVPYSLFPVPCSLFPV
ncbi:MAG: hypothetical protein ACLBM4_21805, partial [Dolichospermum sp.]